MPITSHLSSVLTCDRCPTSATFTALVPGSTRAQWRLGGWAVSRNAGLLQVHCPACRRQPAAPRPARAARAAREPAAKPTPAPRLDLLLAGR